MSDFVLVKPVPVYLCGVQTCQRTFFCRGALTWHRKHAHHMEKPMHRCPECQKEFRYNSLLLEHLWTHMHRPKRERCPVCLSVFVYKRSLLRHQRNFGHFNRIPFE